MHALPHARLPALAVTPEAPGRYERRGILGAGAIGFVELCWDRHLGREVALKRLRPGMDAETTDRFLREARVGALLSHPGIVPVYELGSRADGSLYYTMMRVQGRTLARALEGADLPERLALLPHLVAVCYALAFAHTQGVVHRDLKPDNIMLGDHGETRVVDWGLCCERSSETSGPVLAALEALRHSSGTQTLVGAPIGTPAYMPPEQARGQLDRIDARADVYAMGAVLYELLTGEPPYPGATALHILTHLLAEPLQPPESLEPAAPKELCAIVTRCLAKNPADRYPSMLALAQDLLAFRTGRRVAAHAYGRRARVGRWFARRQALSLALAAAFAAGVAGWCLRAQVEAPEARAPRTPGPAMLTAKSEAPTGPHSRQ